MEANSPAILIVPVHESVDPQEMESIVSAIADAVDGQVIGCHTPIMIYHFIDGLWIESGDLTRLLVVPEQSNAD